MAPSVTIDFHIQIGKKTAQYGQTANKTSNAVERINKSNHRLAEAISAFTYE